MCAIDAKRGGACLLRAYVDKDRPLAREYHRGHVWKAPAETDEARRSPVPGMCIPHGIHAKSRWRCQRYEATGRLSF
ncbi:hypothetical protein PT2222_420020 [Paraburkholderia tropica]